MIKKSSSSLLLLFFVFLSAFFLSMQCGRVAAAGSGPGWLDGSASGAVRRNNNHHCAGPQLMWHADLQEQQETAGWERDEAPLRHRHHHHHRAFISGGGSSSGSPPGTSLFGYDSAGSAAMPLSSQLKSEM